MCVCGFLLSHLYFFSYPRTQKLISSIRRKQESLGNISFESVSAPAHPKLPPLPHEESNGWPYGTSNPSASDSSNRLKNSEAMVGGYGSIEISGVGRDSRNGSTPRTMSSPRMKHVNGPSPPLPPSGLNNSDGKHSTATNSPSMHYSKPYKLSPATHSPDIVSRSRDPVDSRYTNNSQFNSNSQHDRFNSNSQNDRANNNAVSISQSGLGFPPHNQDGGGHSVAHMSGRSERSSSPVFSEEVLIHF